MADLYQTQIVELQRSTGHSIALIGTDYGRGRNDAIEPDHRAANQVLIQHWRKGGLVTVTWSASNPWTGGTA